ncbi:MAG TPA: TolC family protein [Blastocatellia bacterium]|nr:TolC family protein [Blastocatellia bacterium]
MTNWLKISAVNLAALIMINVCAISALGQTPAPAGQQQDPQTTQQAGQQPQQQKEPLEIQARPIPQRTIGLESGKVQRWTLRDAILAALDNNPDIELERVNVRKAQFDLFAAEGFYDPVATSSFNYNSQIVPNTSRNTGLGSNIPDINFKTINYNAGYQQYYERLGGFYSIAFNNSRSTSNQATLSPNYRPSLTFNITQPLFRNFKIDTNRRLIKIQKKNLDLSDAVFRQRAIEIISSVQRAYWDLAFAIKNEEIQRESVKLAETQLNNNKRQVEVGTLAPIDVVSAATELETRRQNVFQAMNTVAQAENAIKQLTVNGVNDELWVAQIVPVESFEVQTAALPLPDAMKLALDNRPELRQLSLQKEINQVNIDYYRNQAKPQIDFVASYGTNGAGGTPAVSTFTGPNCSSPLPLGNGQLVCVGTTFVPVTENGQIVRYTVGTTTTPYNPNFTVASTAQVSPTFVGGYGTALSNLFKNDFRTWQVGVNISLPLRNRTAKANLGRALEETRQNDLQIRRTAQSIEVEVRNAVNTVDTARMRIEATRAARQYAQQQLEGEEKKFQAGLSTTFFVLTRQTDLSRAQGEELRAMADFNKAVAELQRVIATTLSSNSVDVKTAEPASIK